MTNPLKNTDRLALSTVVMTAMCFIAMVLPDFIGWMSGQGAFNFLSMLFLFSPVLVFGIVAARRRIQNKKNALFFTKVVAVSQFVIAVMVIALIKMLQILDENNSGSNWMAYLWIISTIVTIVIYVKTKKMKNKTDELDEEHIHTADHIWAVLPLALFAIFFFINIIITVKSQKLFFLTPQQEINNGFNTHNL